MKLVKGNMLDFKACQEQVTNFTYFVC